MSGEPLSLVRASVKRIGATGTGKLLGVSEGTVRAWLAGRASPRPKASEAILRILGATSAPSSSKAVNRDPPPIDDGPLEPRAELAAMVRDLRAELGRLQNDPKATPRERAQLAASVTGAMRLLTKIDGPPQLTISAILRSEPWVKLREEIIGVLADHREALAAVSARLRQLAE